MKRIPLRTLDDEQTGTLRWSEMIRTVVRQPQDKQSGASIDEIRKGIRVLDALDHANGVLELEDADWEHLKTKVIAMRWGVIDPRLVTFYDDITMASEQVALNDQ